MVSKKLIFPKRVRQLPKQFSWLDHRLVRDHHIEQCSHAAAALYLFLVTVGDVRGLSHYADDSIMKRLSMDSNTLEKARGNLIRSGLIAWQPPLYQVLSLDLSVTKATPRDVLNTPLSLGDILKQAIGGAHD
jgi:hypothetical protein